LPEDSSILDKDRNVIPRWRDFHTTVAIGEISSSEDFQSQWDVDETDSLIPKLWAWQTYKSVPFAADLVASAFVLGRYAEADEAARFILEQQNNVTDSLRGVAYKLLNPSSDEDRDGALEQLHDPDTQQIRYRIHRIRVRLHDEPRNAIAYVELARAYTLLNQKDHAKQAMRMAIKLAPTNRFVLRSASRLFLHTDDLDEAHHVLRSADTTKFDPWLVSAEIAVASAADRPPRFAKAGQRMIVDFSDSPFEITELASALATLEFHNGKSRDARKLYRKALIKPTENSLAQIEWASRRIAGLDFVDATKIQVPRNYEARAWENFGNGNWVESFNEAWNWFYDQPFSSRPGQFGSYIASSILEEYDQAERMIEHNLRTNPDDGVLLNNLAFVYASTGRVKEATETLNRISQLESGSSLEITVKATRGLIAFRSGKYSEGRSLYLESIEGSKKYIRSFQATAALYYAREEILANTPMKEEAVNLALEVSKGIEDKHIAAIREKILDLDKKGKKTN